MKLKSWLKYLIYGILIFGLVIMERYIDMRCTSLAAATYDVRYLYFRLASFTLFGVLAGALLGLDTLLTERKKSGRWKVKLPKLLFLCLPAFFFIVIPYLSWIIPSLALLWSSTIWSYSLDFLYISSVLFGNFAITCFYKHSNIIAKLETPAP